MFNDYTRFECIHENNSHNDSRGHNMSCTSHFFEVGTIYKGYMSSDLSANYVGELVLSITIEILDGGCDGYDTPSGVWFEYLEDFNQYFKVVQED